MAIPNARNRPFRCLVKVAYLALLPSLLLLTFSLAFLGKPRVPAMIVFNHEGKLGVVEANQFTQLLDKPIPTYVAWDEAGLGRYESELAYFSGMLRAFAPDSSYLARESSSWWSRLDRWGLTLIARSPPIMALTRSLGFPRKLSVNEVGEKEFIWTDDTRNALEIAIPVPPVKPVVPFAIPVLPVGPTIPFGIPFPQVNLAILFAIPSPPVYPAMPFAIPFPALASFQLLPIEPLLPNSLHIARIPLRAERPNGAVGHVKPASDREAVWLKTIQLDPLERRARRDASGPAKTSRARELKQGDYSVGWLFVITKCDREGECKLSENGEADCLQPETLSKHVLGMTHLIIPRGFLSGADQPDDLPLNRGGGLVLLTGGDYDYVSLRVSHYPASGRQSFTGNETPPPSATTPSQTRKSSIAMLDERLHEVLAQINRANDMNDGDLVLILPAALDFELGEKDYLIVGFDDIPAPLRSHYRGGKDLLASKKNGGAAQ